MRNRNNSLTQAVLESQTPDDESTQQLNTDSTLYTLDDDELCQLAATHSGKGGYPEVKAAAVAELTRRAELQAAIEALGSRQGRRRFLQSILGVSLLSLLPKTTEAESPPDSDFKQRKDPYPDPLRQAVVDRFIRKIDDCLIPIERFYSCLLDWNEQAPNQVDGHEVMTLLWDAKEAADELASTIECGDLDHNADELVTRLSGKPLAYLCIKDEIINEVLPPSRIQVEIDSFCQEYPQYRAELQLLLWSKQGGKNG